MGLDTDAFSTCLDSGKYTQAINDQTNIGRQLGVSSTPTFAVNGIPLVGAQPFDQFKQTIDTLLAP